MFSCTSNLAGKQILIDPFTAKIQHQASNYWKIVRSVQTPTPPTPIALH